MESSGIRTYKDLEAWQLSMDLTVEIYFISNKFPRTEMYGLTSQMRRSALSVTSNIAEGACRASSKEFIRFLNIALGSLAELDTQIILAVRIEIARVPPRLFKLIESVRKLIYGLIRFLRK